MSKENEKRDIEELRGFLIKRFVQVLLVVGVIEYLVTLILNEWFFPFMQWYFFGNIHTETHVSVLQIIFIFILLFLLLLLTGLKSILPTAAEMAAAKMIEGIEQLGRKLEPELVGNRSLAQMSGQQGVLLFLFIIAIIVLMLIPFAVGAVWYAWVTAKEVQKIEKKRDALREEFDKKRNLMLSDIAHDLRTPITTVAGYARALSDGMVGDEKKQQEYLDAIQTKSARMNELIQLLFEYVKLESDGFSLDRRKMDLSELLRKNAALMYSDVEEAGMELVVEIPETPCIIEADEIQMSRVITNLLTNAIRHNEPGTRILLSQKKDGYGIFVAVADTGGEIPPETAEHLFEPFAMGDRSRSSKGGSGLGLSIAHKIVEMHGWELTFTSVFPGYTKAFYMELN